ncbi:hypothetical protein A3A76_02905 [Candidatus Woesebacteria bacterium RIFCSPLOWO2_01_FULL_39_23]|uniref:Uncharacterized protein n=1 Tax=Candidatus Woesebacteria bacterium RIFCSPHIGHO2_01_FULL_40_22 TaxID=1802499 RepID=A0A1F7YJH9_9BACT|nr:MAG: hypothetical protein A2141_01115 [Candidatus Woesebacteria bacterium RBG_16_40_11]OGM27422.1 MAG: hypothetical protein A2628_01310 [Candidatus Woesebacteria bacterium RIFCSPHIGHO2_01_FULL_40_22]OGM36184.1 MAG: hypothetical protein A3E41_01595 [Candidatus Woesebacteria bacterium RIFCSPHIGHO2_12_FULL_38_9]OGM62594.1 MAG: hypothetical protein A3A76_02905 [Candidatus Woesebacteria bacterium RIFCSPLOWO2_01_FULL_39_23]
MGVKQYSPTSIKHVNNLLEILKGVRDVYAKCIKIKLEYFMNQSSVQCPFCKGKNIGDALPSWKRRLFYIFIATAKRYTPDNERLKYCYKCRDCGFTWENKKANFPM